MHAKLSDSGNYSDANSSQIYAYASPDQVPSHSTTESEPYNSLDFSGKPVKPQLPVEVDSQYNRLEIGSPSSQGMSSNGGVNGGRAKSNMYEDPADLVPPDKPPTTGNMPQYAHVNKAMKGRDASSGPKLNRKRPGTMTLKEDIVEEDANPTSPRYTVVEPDMSDTDSEDNFLEQTGEKSHLYAETHHDFNSSTSQDTDLSIAKSRMPPYAKVNKSKKTNAKGNIDRGVYDKLQRPLTTQFTIDDADGIESDQTGEYSHLIANPQIKRGYSKLDYGSPHVNTTAKPKFTSANTYAELQVSPES